MASPTPDVSDRRTRLEQALRKSRTPGPLSKVFAYLVGSQVGVAILGLVFWTIAMRSLSAEQVGIGAALVAAMALLSTLGVFGVGTFLLERFKVTEVKDRHGYLQTGLAVAFVGAGILTALWIIFTELVRVPGSLGNISTSTAVLLIVSTGVAAICAAFDQAVIGMGASNLQLRRNLIASAVRILVFCVALTMDFRTGQAILASWAIGLVVSLLTTPLRRHLTPRDRLTRLQRWQLMRSNWGTAIGHHSLTLAFGTSTLMLPVVVASLMSAVQTAHFASARLIAESALGLLYFLTIALFATVEGTEGFRRKAPRTLVLGTLLAVVMVAGAALCGRIVLSAFGSGYAEASLPPLVLLLAAGPALLIKEHYVVLRRLEGKLKRGAVVMGLWTLAELAGAIIGGLAGGLTMLCVGWLVVTSAGALCLLPVVLRAVRPSKSPKKSAVE